MKITKRETGRINEVVRADNFRLVVPSAVTIEEAIVYWLGCTMDTQAFTLHIMLLHWLIEFANTERKFYNRQGLGDIVTFLVMNIMKT